jgi:uncharacterized protein (TIGR00251 family)
MIASGDRPWMTVGVDEVTIEVAARPSAARRGVVRESPEALVVAVHSSPNKGQANAELVEYLAGELKVPRSAMMIVRGATSRRKTIRIVTHEASRVASRLLKLADEKSVGSRK